MINVLLEHPYTSIIVLIGFFLGTGAAYYFKDKYNARKKYMSVFIIMLIVVNITSVQIMPFLTMHKFTSATAEERTQYEFRMVDEHGNEIKIDARAIDWAEGRIHQLARNILADCDGDEVDLIASSIYSQTVEYRSSIESGNSIYERMKFPRHGLDPMWSAETLDQYEKFVALRIYEIEMDLTDDGTDFDSLSERQVYEWKATNKKDRKENVGLKGSNNIMCSDIPTIWTVID